MEDSFGREIKYLRISVTDRCNLRCRYCMPNGIETIPMSQILTFEEIAIVAKAAASLGINHIKVTGGEPLVRRGIIDLIRMLKNIPGIDTVTLTTNGVLLNEHLSQLKALGIDGINVSLDTFDKKQYEAITGFDEFDNVYSAILNSINSGIKTKINVVSMSGVDYRPFFELARKYPIDVRFIEVMPIGFGKYIDGIKNSNILKILSDNYGMIEMDKSCHGNGPSIYYNVKGLKGSIGFISAVHKKFCNSCNRIRLSSTGFLKPCLCYSDGVSLKEILRGGGNDDATIEKLKSAIAVAIKSKPKEHCFDMPSKISEKNAMVAIGG